MMHRTPDPKFGGRWSGRFLLATLVLLAIFAAGTSSAAAGSPVDPEIVDAAQDVSYSPLHSATGPRPHLDLLAGWFTYNESTKAIDASFRVASGRALSSPPTDSLLDYWFRANVTLQNERTGVLGFRWTSHGFDTIPKTNVTWTPVAVVAQAEPLGHLFRLDSREPGVLTFSVDRATLTGVGDELQLVAGSDVREYFTPRPGFGTMASFDRFDETGRAFSLIAGQPAPGKAGLTVSEETGERDTAPGAAEEGPRAASPAFEAWIGVAAVGLILVWRRLPRAS